MSGCPIFIQRTASFQPCGRRFRHQRSSISSYSSRRAAHPNHVCRRCNRIEGSSCNLHHGDGVGYAGDRRCRIPRSLLSRGKSHIYIIDGISQPPEMDFARREISLGIHRQACRRIKAIRAYVSGIRFHLYLGRCW